MLPRPGVSPSRQAIIRRQAPILDEAYPDMSSPAVQTAETVAKRPWQLPTIGGKYFALAILFSMNLLNYIDRYSFFAAGDTDQGPSSAHR